MDGTLGPVAILCRLERPCCMDGREIWPLLLDTRAGGVLTCHDLSDSPRAAPVMPHSDPVEAFIAAWRDTGGSELANTQSFVNGLCAVVGASPPQGSRTDDALNDYVFERRVFQDNGDGTESFGRVDCYKRGHFVLEAKQGSEADKAAADKNEADLDLFGQTASQRVKRGTARRGTPAWTKAMVQAKGQSERYAKALPADHGWPPFLLIVDVGYCIEVYADFTGTGKAYVQFPDRSGFRIMLDDLRDAAIRDRLRAIWDDPKSLDPAAHAAKATRDIATLLATVARRLEARGHSAESTSEFLMRVLFTIFAEDTKLIPKGGFSTLLKSQRGHPEALHHQLSALWAAMDQGTFSPALGTMMRKFNGYLFKEHAAIPINAEELEVLIQAATADWTLVEPAIFGTLLERALDPKERAKLGAHYTPRAYVERLVMPTIIEPLRADWLGVRAAAVKQLESGDPAEARRHVESFHAKLAQIKVLDPACGTGNFLYVAMSRMKELESEIIDLLSDLGDQQYVAEISGHTLTPENFLGIEVNPRAAAIAQLVLWIGYLQWHFRVAGQNQMPAEPILRDIRTIETRDALITWDVRTIERDDSGHPVTIWDGTTMKVHPVSGKLVPDDSARMEIYRYGNPRPAKWPKADFIVGNPPFIGNKRMRERLGDGYTEAVRRAYGGVPETVDFVMYWWAIAAAAGTMRRFGFITTNSITQPFNRVVIEAAKCRLLFAVPDHPWVDGVDGAAVRIAITSGGMESGMAILETVTSETEIPDGYGERAVTVQPQSAERLNADLTIGVDAQNTVSLKANRDIAIQGMNPLGLGFRLTEAHLREMKIDPTHPPENLKPYLIGRDLVQRPERKWVIDFYGLTEKEAANANPILFQHILTHVKPERDQNRRAVRKDNWWLFGENAPTLRRGIEGLNRFIGTCRTAKYRIFVFIPGNYIVDAKIVGIALDDAFHLAVLTSHIHQIWAFRTGAWLGVGNDSNYNHAICFNRFPFPSDVSAQLTKRIRADGEALDAIRKKVLSENPDLTLTGLYNVLEALRASRPLSEEERGVHDRGLVSLIRQHHDAMDLSVAEAYGWPAGLAQEDILARLVTLNRERAAEEEKEQVRWLRPELQAPGVATEIPQILDLGETAAAVAIPILIPWPKSLPDQVTAISKILTAAPKPLSSREVARAFDGKRASTIEPVLNALVAIGQARRLADGRYAA
jgi:hypothetical protein